jgi:hypothetical protein
MGSAGLPRLLDRRPCEGLAEVSLIAADDHRTTVMATPLYVRVRQLPEPNDAIKGRRKSLRSLLSTPEQRFNQPRQVRIRVSSTSRLPHGRSVRCRAQYGGG